MSRIASAARAFPLQAAGLALATALTSPGAIGVPQQDVFRGGVTIVPIDVRAFDRHGKPVTDLTARDFTIVEDGVPHGSYRKIEVRTSRPGVSLRFRGGYYARPMPAALGRRELLSHTRISRAFEYAPPIDDIKVQGRVAMIREPNGDRRITVDVTIDSSRMAYHIVDGRHVGSIEVAVFAIDGRQRQVVDLWQRVELNLSEARYRTFMAGGIPYSATLRIPPDVRAVKVVAYDYGADLLGSVVLNAR